MEESTLRWPTDKEREEMEEVCSIKNSSYKDVFKCFSKVASEMQEEISVGRLFQIFGAA